MTDYPDGQIPKFADQIRVGDRLFSRGMEFLGTVDRIVTVTEVRSDTVHLLGQDDTPVFSFIGQDDAGGGWSSCVGGRCIMTLVVPEFVLEGDDS